MAGKSTVVKLDPNQYTGILAAIIVSGGAEPSFDDWAIDQSVDAAIDIQSELESRR